MRIGKWFKEITATVLVAFVVLLAALNFFSSAKGTGLLGYKGYTVISGSMQPALKLGDYVVVKKTAFSQLKTGEIITFAANDTIVTHRITEKTAAGCVTKGDANTIADLQPVTSDSYIGTLQLRIPKLGQLMIWMQRPLIYGLVLAAVFTRLAVMVLFKK